MSGFLSVLIGNNAAAGGGAFNPSSTFPDLWIDPSVTASLFQTITGTTAVASDGDPVGFATDQGAGAFNLVGTANTTVRPLYKTSAGISWLNFTSASSQKIHRTSANLGLYSGGASTVLIAVQAPSAALSQNWVHEGGTDSLVDWIKNDNTTASSANVFIRTDAGAVTILNNTPITTNVFNSSWHIYCVTGDGATCRTYLDNATSTTAGYTPSGTLTVDRFALGVGDRNSPLGFVDGNIGGVLCWKRVLTATERGNATTWLGAKVGLTI
jgi:hypothetical protein